MFNFEETMKIAAAHSPEVGLEVDKLMEAVNGDTPPKLSDFVANPDAAYLNQELGEGDLISYVRAMRGFISTGDQTTPEIFAELNRLVTPVLAMEVQMLIGEAYSQGAAESILALQTLHMRTVIEPGPCINPGDHVPCPTQSGAVICSECGKTLVVE